MDCPKCDRAFILRAPYHEHLRTVHHQEVAAEDDEPEQVNLNQVTTREFKRATCMCERSFIFLPNFRKHVTDVHAKDPIVFATFEATLGEEGEEVEVTTGVPYGAPWQPDAAKEADDEPEAEAPKLDPRLAVNRGDDQCEDCAANQSAGRLPVHPKCNCEPESGWETFLDELAEMGPPEDVSEERWSEFLDSLEQVASGDGDVWMEE